MFRHHRPDHARAFSAPMHDRVKSRREIPAVGKLLEQIHAEDLPRPLVVDAVRNQVALYRKSRGEGDLMALIPKALDRLRLSRLRSLVNGTRVVIHTNLGRVPLATEAPRALEHAGRTYTNLEFDLSDGARGKRGDYVERALAALCNAEAACVVNNCAAALVLIVRHFTKQEREVVISRGELVQIGGGFRIGEIVEAAGATLREVGRRINDFAGLQSRNRIADRFDLESSSQQFLHERLCRLPSTAELAASRAKSEFRSSRIWAAVPSQRPKNLPNLSTNRWRRETLRAGADLICFSGDKLFGGPQAGIIAGRARFVSALKREPLFRALRCDKLVLSALQATADLHLAKNYAAIPALAFLQIPVSELQERAEKILAQLKIFRSRRGSNRLTRASEAALCRDRRLSRSACRFGREKFLANKLQSACARVSRLSSVTLPKPRSCSICERFSRRRTK